MDIQSEAISGSGDEFKGETSNPSFFAFVPAIAILTAMMITSNVILLVLLVRSWRFSTSLNILLSNLGYLNLFTLLNQVALIIAIINNRWILGEATCRLVAMIQTCSRWSIVEAKIVPHQSSNVHIQALFLFDFHERGYLETRYRSLLIRRCTVTVPELNRASSIFTNLNINNYTLLATGKLLI